MTAVKPLMLVSCPDCRHLKGTRCNNFASAELSTATLSTWLIERQQRCPGFTARAPPPAPAPPPPDRPHPPQTEPETENETTMIISENATTYTPCPPGSYLARCVRLIDCGTQQSDYQGEVKTAHKIAVSFEVLDDEARMTDGRNFMLSKRYTASLHEKSALRKDLASWRGRDFTPDELNGFDLVNVLGKLAFISVVEVNKPDGKTYTNLASLMKPPKGMTAPDGAATEPLLHWDMEAAQPDWTAFDALHERLQNQIAESPEFKKLKRPTDDGTPADTDSDDIPF